MAITSEDLVRHGKALCGGGSEADWRAAIGRSYYGAYHAANGWHEALATQGVCPPGFGTHETLLQCLEQPSVPRPLSLRSKALGYVLRMHKALRVTADYQLSSSVDRAMAETAVAYGEQILEKAK